MDDTVYFELNNWFADRDYPNDQPFINWMKNDLNITLRDDEWARDNQLAIVYFPLDMSQNFLISAAKSWVEENCPKLLTLYKEFLRFPDTDGCVYSKWGPEFKEYKPSEFGVTEIDDPYEVD